MYLKNLPGWIKLIQPSNKITAKNTLYYIEKLNANELLALTIGMELFVRENQEGR